MNWCSQPPPYYMNSPSFQEDPYVRFLRKELKKAKKKKEEPKKDDKKKEIWKRAEAVAILCYISPFLVAGYLGILEVTFIISKRIITGN